MSMEVATITGEEMTMVAEMATEAEMIMVVEVATGVEVAGGATDL